MAMPAQNPAPAQPSNVGPNKAIASGIAGAIITVALYIVNLAWHVTVPAEVAAALTTLVGTALVYIVPHGG